MTRILGIDPGLRVTGYGIIDVQGDRLEHVDNGCIRVAAGELPERLKVIFEGVGEVVRQFRPDQMAIEKVFVNRNADSALKLGQARGAAICAAVLEAVPVSEYTPRQIKQAATGSGSADKEQVAHMVRALAGIKEKLPADASDALAIALCHSHSNSTLGRMTGARSFRGGRFR